MKLTLLGAVLACAATSSPAIASHPLPNATITIALDGRSVLDAAGNTGAGDPDASGVARLEWDHATLVWEIDYENVGGETITGAHVHGRFGGFDRVPFLDLPLPPLRPLPDGTLRGVMTPADDAGLLTKLTYIFYTSETGKMFLDLHTAGPGGFPAGAIAGQLPEPGGAAVLLGVAWITLTRRRRHVSNAHVGR